MGLYPGVSVGHFQLEWGSTVAKLVDFTLRIGSMVDTLW
jgi:hypothetical protein